MSRVPYFVLIPLAGAFTLSIGLGVSTSPAEARKFGKAVAGAAALTAGKSAARAASREKSDDAEQDALSGTTAPNSTESDRATRAEAAATRANAQLLLEKNEGAALAPTSGQLPPAAAAVCVAGCGYGRPLNR